MEFDVSLIDAKSHIVIQKDAHRHLQDYITFPKRVLVITDAGVPDSLVQTVLAQIPSAILYTTLQGEKAKSFEVYQDIIHTLLKHDFSRSDMIVALGGGVIGDLSGFVASTYKRGMKFVSIPTTTLSQIDSSIGGKVAINMNEIKNCIGNFYHPSVVIIDMNTLKTLPERHFYNGLIEAVKAGLIADKRIFELFEEQCPQYGDKNTDVLEEIITRSLLMKKEVVEQDEKEKNIRKILNFGHTYGHAIESIYHLQDYYHGECVGLGMMEMLENEEIKVRLRKILDALHQPSDVKYDLDQCVELIRNDKKATGNSITIVQVHEVGKAELIQVEIESLRKGE